MSLKEKEKVEHDLAISNGKHSEDLLVKVKELEERINEQHKTIINEREKCKRFTIDNHMGVNKGREVKEMMKNNEEIIKDLRRRVQDRNIDQLEDDLEVYKNKLSIESGRVIEVTTKHNNVTAELG